MPFARNGLDGRRVYFEDDGGGGPPVVFLNGLGDPIASSRAWGVSEALSQTCRCLFVDHRGHGRSDKPHDAAAYTTRLRVADVIAVLDKLGIDRAHIIGASWGARLAFGIGEQAPERVLSLVLGGQIPYAMNLESPGVAAVTRAFEGSNTMEGFLEALGGLGDVDETVRASVLDNDALALSAAWQAAMTEGDVVTDLARWKVPCLIYAGTGDVDFYADARRAAGKIPVAQFVALEGLNHLDAHSNVDQILPHIRQILERALG